MLIAENVKQGLLEARTMGAGYNDHSCEEYIHHEVAKIIPNDIDVDNLILAYKIKLNEYENNDQNVLPFIGVIPRYISQVASKEFTKEFRKKYITEIMGLPAQPELETDYGYTEVEENIIDISNKNKYAVLAALYNYATPVGMGFQQYDPRSWDEQIAEMAFEKFGEVDNDGSVYFKYVLGRPLRCAFKDNLLYVAAYNAENIEDLGQLAVSSVPNINQKEIAPQKVKKD